jgi:RNA polymerase sigma-70 factor (ECF subfamily)
MGNSAADRKLADPSAGAVGAATELLEGCRAQQPEAFRSFVLLHQDAVFALISRLVGRGPQTADLAQEAFLRAYRGFPNFDPAGPASARTWLLTITVRLALNARRRRARAPEVFSLSEAASLPHASTPETEQRRRELGLAIERAAATLSDEQRAVFVLAEFHGLTLAEIASALDMHEATVKTRLFRARNLLRKRLASFEKGWRE